MTTSKSEAIAELRRRGITDEQMRARGIELPESSKTGWGAVGRDILDLPSKIKQAAQAEVKEFPEQFSDLGQQVMTDLPRVGKSNLIEGARAIHGTLSLPGALRDYLLRKKVIPENTPSFRFPENKFPKDFPEEELYKEFGMGQKRPGDVLGGIIPQLAVGAPSVGRGLAAAAPHAGKAALTTGRIAQELGAGMKRGLNKGITGVNKLRPTEMFRGNLTPHQLTENVRIAHGTNTPLGDVIGSPTLKKFFENVSSEVPLAGGEEQFGNIANQVRNRAESIVGQLGKNVKHHDPNVMIYETLNEAYKNQNKIKNELYEPVSKLASKENFQVTLPTFSKLANDSIEAIERSPLLQTDSQFKKAFNKILNYQNPIIEKQSLLIDKSGKPLISETIHPSIVEVKMVANKLEDQGNKLLNSPLDIDRSLGGLYTRLAKAAREDVKTGINSRGSPELKSQYEKAEKNYAKNYSPFLDREVYKLLRNEKDAEIIIDKIVKLGKGDRAGTIEKIQKLLPPEQKNTLGYAILKRAEDKEGILDPKQVAQIAKKIGIRQFKALFPDKNVRRQILDYGKLRGMNEEALNRMYNPKTGARNTKAIIGALQAGLGGMTTGSGAPISAALGYGASVLAAKIFNKAMTSEATRRKFVSKIVQREHKKANRES